MQGMFQVRSARALAPSFQSASPCLPLAPPPQPHTLPPPHGAAPRPASHALLSTLQNTPLSDANKLLIRCAWAGNAEFVTRYGSAWSDLGACSPPPPTSPPPPLLSTSPPPLSPPPQSPPSPPLAPFADEPCTETTQDERCKVTLKIKARLLCPNPCICPRAHQCAPDGHT